MSPAADRSGIALTLTDAPSETAREVERAAAEVSGLGTQVEATIEWAVRLSGRIPLPGQGRTADRWSALATAAALDVGAARILEPHLDALAILDEARTAGGIASDGVDGLGADEHSSWGVFAAEGATRLDAYQDASGSWRLRGTKPWCSLAAQLTHALITAWVSPQSRRLFAVPLQAPSVHPHTGPWTARGLRAIVSAAVDFDDTPAAPVGDPEWYLHRPGFRWGGMGVAAVWWGSVIPIIDALAEAARRPNADQIAQLLCGEADAEQWAAKVVLADAARRVDAPTTSHPRELAERVRAVAAGAAERVLTLADHGLGPGPLTTDEQHARRVADLRIYLRQHHAERDLARLGRSVVA
ncbi:acyl-CoA dehydrogenase [Microbacterium protaetiae]|uniref:Acyl-CoA dehydrogenase n=1 Tax=Microbacterium protaetiae TaxID=2509458 RepID=A0A4P6EFR9_9MICO|nr:acyl-CoA dehydrogenase [Microbacterium protaetiae]QAY59989.1 acyl-CoA dehydrogenase [Microbacterium protaetiae]